MTIAKVSGTAFIVAEFRADENTAARPLYQDPIVPLLLTDETHEAAARIATRFRPVKDMVKLRTRYLDDAVDRHLRRGCRQVLILGAGLDTRAVRKAARGVRYFEVDDVATLEWKQACYRRHGIGAAVTFIPGDYVKDGLLEMLIRHGFALEQPTYIIWEGNTMYLPLESVRYVLVQLASALGDFRISFDYVSDAVVAGTTGDPAIATLVESFAAIGATWLTGFADTNGIAAEAALDLFENVSTADLHAAYWGDGPVSSSIFHHYSICTLGA